MKKITLFVIAALSSILIYAQEVRIGLKGGLNIAHLESSQGNLNGSKLGLHAGLLAHIHLNKTWAIQPEVVYSSQGAKYSITDGEHDLSLNYLNIPFQVQYMFNNGFRVQTGPQIGFLTNVKDKINGNQSAIFSSDDFKSIDFSWIAGLGYQSTSGLGIDARYNFGVSNINDAGSATLHNSVFQVGLFYMLNTSGGRK